ncbi:hypothetical protein EJ02DRAFT_362752, partial [Clathrospora elynae]
HIYNPAWPPHAQYHSGQTMSMGLFIGLITFYILYSVLPNTKSAQIQLTHLDWVLLLQNLIYLSSLSGIFYPCALFMDPKFGKSKLQLYSLPVFIAIA